MKEVLQSILYALMIGFCTYTVVILLNKTGTNFQCNSRVNHHDEEAERVTRKVEEGIEKAKKVQEMITGSSSKSRKGTSTSSVKTNESASQKRTESAKSVLTANSTTDNTYNYTPPPSSRSTEPSFAKDGKTYQIQLATISKGKIELDRFKSIEEFGSISVDKKGRKSRVLIGDFYSKDEAAYYLSLIKRRGHRDAFVVKDLGRKAVALKQKPPKKAVKKQKKKASTTKTAKTTKKTTLTTAGPPTLNIEVVRPVTSSEGQFAVRLGKYKSPSKKELSQLNDLGVVYMIEEKLGLYIAYLGNYTDQKSLDVVLEQVKKRGFKGAFETNALSFGTTGMIFVDEKHKDNQALVKKKETKKKPVTEKASPPKVSNTNNSISSTLELNDFIIQLVSANEPDIEASKALTYGGNVYTQYDPRSKRTILYLGGFKDPKRANEVLEDVLTKGFDSAFIKTISTNDLNTIVLLYNQN